MSYCLWNFKINCTY